MQKVGDLHGIEINKQGGQYIAKFDGKVYYHSELDSMLMELKTAMLNFYKNSLEQIIQSFEVNKTANDSGLEIAIEIRDQYLKKLEII